LEWVRGRLCAKKCWQRPYPVTVLTGLLLVTLVAFTIHGVETVGRYFSQTHPDQVLINLNGFSLYEKQIPYILLSKMW